MNLRISPHSQKRETRVGEYGKYSSICPNYRGNMGNIVVFAQIIGRIWEIWGRYNPCWIFSDLSIYPTLFITFFFFSNIVIRNMIKL